MANERLTVLCGGLLRYRYDIHGGEMSFDFHTLAEVGEPYQQWFRDETKARGWVVRYGMELNVAPWVADVRIGEC